MFFFTARATLGIVALSVAACYSALTLLALALWHLRKPERPALICRP